MFRFTKLREADLPQVLEWRIKPRVAERMFTVVENDAEKHREWFAGLKSPCYVIRHDDHPIGLISFSPNGGWGYYIGDDDAVPLGGLIPPYFYNWYFQRHDILKAAVKEGNVGVERMHRFHGYREIMPHCFELTREAWAAHSKRYGHYVGEFET